MRRHHTPAVLPELNQKGSKEAIMWERMKEKRNEGGFTLIELLIVIIILAILAAIVVFAVGNTGQNAKTAACNSDAKTYETALESYKAQVGTYPAYGTGAILTTTQVVASQTVGPFLRQLPQTQHYQIVTDGSGGVFVFATSAAIPAAGSATGDIDYSSFAGNNFDTTPNICVTAPT